MAKNKNIDLYSPFFDAVKDNAVLVNIIIGGKSHPSKAFQLSPLFLVFEDDYIEFVEEKERAVESLKKTAKFGIEKVEIGAIRKPVSGGAIGLFGTLSINLRLELFYTYDKESIVAVCDDISVFKEVFKWFEKNEIPIVDPLDIKSLVNKELEKPLHEYLLEILKQTTNEKYQTPYVNYKGPK